MNKLDRSAIVNGFVDGVKRFNIKKLTSDLDGEYGSYKIGYAGGMVTKVVIAGVVGLVASGGA